MPRSRFSLGILCWLIGISICLATAAVWAQPPDPNAPPGGAQFDPGLLPGIGKEALGEGDRVPTLEAGFTAPASDGSAQLFIVVNLPTGAHTYSLTQPQPGPTPSEIKISPSNQVPKIGAFQSVELPKLRFVRDEFPVNQEQFFGSVKWIAPIQLATGAKPDAVRIEGKVKLELCDGNACAPAKDFPFVAALRSDVNPEKAAEAAAPARDVSSGPPNPVAPPARPETNPGLGKGDDQLKWRKFTTIAALRELVDPKFNIEEIRANVSGSESSLSVGLAIFYGLLGGLILNIMPCVLPVIGLKILSFAQQAGHDRRRALMLNVWYSVGLLSVFIVLATLAVGPQHLGWGQLFGETWFTISLTAVVFVMALSFMGVWEVPLPSFFGRGKAGELASKEGAEGAFFKGAITTLLATPCSAPYLAPALVWATAQPAWLTYTVFLSIGIGMASPYLLLGAFPELLRFLPRPGPWMETFKQFMGFVLIGTVVYLLTILEPYNVVPTIGILFALWFTCWLIGGLSPLAGLGVKLRTWCLGAAVCCSVWIVMFRGIDSRVLGPYEFLGLSAALQERFGLDEEQDPGPPLIGPKTVLVDFTADWCPTCHLNEAAVMRTGPVVEAIREKGVVALKADWSHQKKAVEVTRMLDVLGSKQIPVIAIFSPKDPNHPSIFRGSYTEKDILDALEKAGPSPRAGLASR